MLGVLGVCFAARADLSFGSGKDTGPAESLSLTGDFGGWGYTSVAPDGAGGEWRADQLQGRWHPASGIGVEAGPVHSADLLGVPGVLTGPGVAGFEYTPRRASTDFPGGVGPEWAIGASEGEPGSRATEIAAAAGRTGVSLARGVVNYGWYVAGGGSSGSVELPASEMSVQDVMGGAPPLEAGGLIVFEVPAPGFGSVQNGAAAPGAGQVGSGAPAAAPKRAAVPAAVGPGSAPAIAGGTMGPLLTTADPLEDLGAILVAAVPAAALTVAVGAGIVWWRSRR